MSGDEVMLRTDGESHTLLGATLDRVNLKSIARLAAGLKKNVFDGAPLRELVKEEIERAKLPEGLVRPITDRVAASLRRRSGKQHKFSTYQALAMPASAFKWSPGADRVTMLTAAGRRSIAVRVDRSRGDLHPPLAGRPAALVFRNGEFELRVTDVERKSEDD